MKAVTYSRFSTDRQSESSIADQERVCAEYAERQGWQITEQYRDQGISGAALGNRPGVLKMQEAALGQRFDVLLIMDISRLSRSMGDVAKMTERLVYCGVRIVAIHDNADTARDGWEIQFGLVGLMAQHLRKQVGQKTHTGLESRAKQRKPTGGRAYGYRCEAILEAGEVIGHRMLIDEAEAPIVREIFGRWADGESWRDIAGSLNRRAIPSPGSSWKRNVRRAHAWAGSGIRVIVRNERYHGIVVWNAHKWRKHPDTGQRKRIERPRSEWITYVDESQRIISEELWARSQRRMGTTRGKDDPRLKSGGKVKYLLSGLLRCEVCGAHYTITSKATYGCQQHMDGKACSNTIRVRKDHIEAVLLRGPESGLAGLLAPDRIERMAEEMQRYYAERVRSMQSRAAEAPREVTELTARIERLRERRRLGDPDMAADELEAAIARAEGKLAELEAGQPAMRESAKVLSMLPRAAELYRRQVAAGLDGDARAALKARIFLREWFSGVIRLQPLPDGGLMAHWNQNVTALLKAAGARAEQMVAGASNGRGLRLI